MALCIDPAVRITLTLLEPLIDKNFPVRLSQSLLDSICEVG